MKTCDVCLVQFEPQDKRILTCSLKCKTKRKNAYSKNFYREKTKGLVSYKSEEKELLVKKDKIIAALDSRWESLYDRLELEQSLGTAAIKIEDLMTLINNLAAQYPLILGE